MQDYLRDAPANDRTAQALQGLTFGGGGDGIGLRIGGLLQAQAQFGGDLAQQARQIALGSHPNPYIRRWRSTAATSPSRRA